MVCFSKVFCPCFSRRSRAGSSRGGSSVSDRPSSERRLGNGQPEAQGGGEPQREVELQNRDAAEQPQAPRIGPQPADSMVSFPRLDESPDGDNPSNDVSRQDTPQRDTGIAPQANDTQTNIGGPSNNVSQQGAPQHGTPKPRSRRESRSTAAVPCVSLTLRDLLDHPRSSSASAPQANDTQTNPGSPSNDVESPSSSSDGINSSSSDDSESSRSSSHGDSQATSCKPPDDEGGNTGSSDGAPPVINTQTNVSNPSDNIYQQGAPQHITPKPRIKGGPRRTAAGSLTPGGDLLGGFLNSVSGSSDSAPQVINTQTNVSNPSDNISQQGATKQGATKQGATKQGATKHGTPKPRSRRGSRSIAAGSVATCKDLLGGFLNSVSSSSDGAPPVINTQTNVSNPSDNISQQGAPQQGAPQNGTPKPRSRRGSRSIAVGSVATCKDLLGGFLDSVSGSSHGDPQANGCNPSNDVESASGSTDGAPQVINTQTNRAQNSSGSKRGQDPIISEKEREILGLLNLLH
ncbi:uncharacterized protein FTJAE_10751 [Fusarium tjaetaba]|uniref:Uncharacterized protein n=1 Tax=Fusarium tjaetaba TaxID=1567544 RepID=A0A8H5VFK5_9HYPO|nr:uncharacterized protein FTJAE_10751 [Fusarium tjaetaba]KAF5622772.1 hypothetical protein FTJAE_10751 [Fusarium tjaetaba]